MRLYSFFYLMLKLAALFSCSSALRTSTTRHINNIRSLYKRHTIYRITAHLFSSQNESENEGNTDTISNEKSVSEKDTEYATKKLNLSIRGLTKLRVAIRTKKAEAMKAGILCN